LSFLPLTRPVDVLGTLEIPPETLEKLQPMTKLDKRAEKTKSIIEGARIVQAANVAIVVKSAALVRPT
jgi:hypothetical protein